MLKKRIEKKLERKKNPELVEAILKTKKNKKWLEISNLISRPKRKEIKINLEIIESETKEGDTVVVPGAVLGKGDITKKIRVCALKFSKTALEKLKKSKSETVTILEEVKKNPEAKGIKLLK